MTVMSGIGMAIDGDGGVASLVNPQGTSRAILVCEHASNLMPERFGGLGLSKEQLTSHIAWDPGALELSLRLSSLLDAPLVHQRYSRLLYDCNRPPHAADAVPRMSEIHEIPGNADLDAEALAARAQAYYFPFREALSGFIDARMALPQVPVLVTVHSFTPVYFGKPRSVEIGILHDADPRMALAMADHLKAVCAHDIRLNEPYGPQDGVTHTLREHALPRAIANVMIEIRNDLLADAASVNAIAVLLADAISAANSRMEGERQHV